MKHMTKMALGVCLMFLGTASLATAYHVPNDGTAAPANTWTSGNGLINLCESTGSNDPVNEYIVEGEDLGLPDSPHTHVGLARAGEGGLCYASSQDVTTCTPTARIMVEGGTLPALETELDNLGVAPNYHCDYDDAAAKDKKPIQSTNFADWGFIEPTCATGACVPVKDNGTGQNWFIRIGSNVRSCDGAWGQTFVYKEVVAYYAGTAPDANGISGHVTFFINDPDSAGGYNSMKQEQKNEASLGIIDDDKSFGTATTNGGCTGNGSSWGLYDGTIADANTEFGW